MIRQAIHALQNLFKSKSIERKIPKLPQTCIAALHLNMKLKASRKYFEFVVKVHASFNWNQTKTMCNTACWETFHWEKLGLSYLQATGKSELKIWLQKRNSWRLTRQIFSKTERTHTGTCTHSLPGATGTQVAGLVLSFAVLISSTHLLAYLFVVSTLACRILCRRDFHHLF